MIGGKLSAVCEAGFQGGPRLPIENDDLSTLVREPPRRGDPDHARAENSHSHVSSFTTAGRAPRMRGSRRLSLEALADADTYLVL
jgi:hypothetical protein